MICLYLLVSLVHAYIPLGGECNIRNPNCTSGLICFENIGNPKTYNCRDATTEATPGETCRSLNSFDIKCIKGYACDQGVCKKEVTATVGCGHDTNFNEYPHGVVCKKGLVCALNPKGTIFLCQVPWNSKWWNIVRGISDSYKKLFLAYAEKNITYNIHAIGNPVLKGTKINGILPENDNDRKNSIHQQIQNTFIRETLDKYEIITNATFFVGLNEFVKYMPDELPAAERLSRRNVFSKKLIEKVHYTLDKFSNVSWNDWKDDQMDHSSQLARSLIDASKHSSLNKRVAFGCRSACNWFRNIWDRADSGFEAFGSALRHVNRGIIGALDTVGKGIIQLGQNFRDILYRVHDLVVEIIRIGSHMFLEIIDGIVGFVHALSKGDLISAFSELGKGFVRGYRIALDAVIRGAVGIWNGLRSIGDDIVNFIKALLTLNPKQWAFLVISLAISIAIMVYFPTGSIIASTIGSQGTFATAAAVVSIDTVVGSMRTIFIDPVLKGIIGLTPEEEADAQKKLDRDNPGNNFIVDMTLFSSFWTL